LGIAQDKVFRSWGIRVQRSDALDGLSLAAPVITRKRLCELSLLIQTRVGRKRSNEALGAVRRRFAGQDTPSFSKPSVHETGGKKVGSFEGNFVRWEVSLPVDGTQPDRARSR